jgi:hypothetical protein
MNYFQALVEAIGHNFPNEDALHQLESKGIIHSYRPRQENGWIVYFANGHKAAILHLHDGDKIKFIECGKY